MGLKLEGRVGRWGGGGGSYNQQVTDMSYSFDVPS